MNSKLTLVPDFTHALYFKLHKLQNKHKLLPDKLACQSKTDLAYTMIKRNTPSYRVLQVLTVISPTLVCLYFLLRRRVGDNVSIVTEYVFNNT